MQNDAIAAALRAAVVQLAPTTCGTPEHHQHRCAPCLCRKNARAAIAAFLDHYAPHHAAQGMMGPDLHEIAAAVARVSKESKHG